MGAPVVLTAMELEMACDAGFMTKERMVELMMERLRDYESRCEIAERRALAAESALTTRINDASNKIDGSEDTTSHAAGYAKIRHKRGSAAANAAEVRSSSCSAMFDLIDDESIFEQSDVRAVSPSTSPSKVDLEDGGQDDEDSIKHRLFLDGVWSRMRRSCPVVLRIVGQNPPTISVRTVGIALYLAYLQFDVHLLKSSGCEEPILPALGSYFQ